MKTEFYVLPESPLIGKTFGELKKEYNVGIDHFHNPRLGRGTRSTPVDSRHITPRLVIKIEGNRDDVARVVKDST